MFNFLSMSYNITYKKLQKFDGMETNGKTEKHILQSFVKYIGIAPHCMTVTTFNVLLFRRGSGDYFDQYYQRPYCRMQPYLVGMYTGYLLYKTKCKCKINNVSF